MADTINKKALMVQSLPGIGQTVLIIVLILLFHPSIIVLAGLLLFLSLIKRLYDVYKAEWLVAPGWGVKLLKQSGVLLITISCLYLLNIYLGGYGFLGLFIIVLVIAGLILWRKRTAFINTIRAIEKEHFGETAEERKKRRQDERDPTNE